MKTGLKLHSMVWLIGLTLTFGLSSCVVDGFGLEIGSGTDSYREYTNHLCRYVWVDEWETNGKFYHQELTFYPDQTGSDYMYIEDRWGRTESTYNFIWDWYDNFYTSIRLNYGRGDYSYIDGIRWGDRNFSCFFDNEAAYFTAY